MPVPYWPPSGIIIFFGNLKSFYKLFLSDFETVAIANWGHDVEFGSKLDFCVTAVADGAKCTGYSLAEQLVVSPAALQNAERRDTLAGRQSVGIGKGVCAAHKQAFKR